eukprot:scaffold55590_cov72-Phaeocystis_antarctica.AAC.5
MILCVAAIPRGSPRSKQRQGVVEPISSRFWKLAKRRRPDPCYFEGAYNSVCEADTVMPLGDNTVLESATTSLLHTRPWRNCESPLRL